MTLFWNCPTCWKKSDMHISGPKTVADHSVLSGPQYEWERMNCWRRSSCEGPSKLFSVLSFHSHASILFWHENELPENNVKLECGAKIYWKATQQCRRGINVKLLIWLEDLDKTKLHAFLAQNALRTMALTVYYTRKNEQMSNVVEKATVFIGFFRCFLSIFPFFGFEKVLHIKLLICVSDEYFGT